MSFDSKMVPVLSVAHVTNPEQVKELIEHLRTKTTSITIDDFEITYLGGNNNKNWKAVHYKR